MEGWSGFSKQTLNQYVLTASIFCITLSLPLISPNMQKTKGSIFINYRKDDSNWNALALYNELQKYFSADQIFKDFNAIQPGDDFVESINKALHTCDVLLVLIGKNWLSATNAAGQRRLDDPEDFVRLEIAGALERNIKVIPVMLDNTPMPQEHELPENLHSLSRRQFISIDPIRFGDDVRHLSESIKKILADCGYEQSMPASSAMPPPAPQPVSSQASYSSGQHASDSHKPAKPDNNLIYGILSTLLCCLPLGIMSIVSANKVDNLYAQGQYAEAQAAADQAKKYAIWAAIGGAIVGVIYGIVMAANGGY